MTSLTAQGLEKSYNGHRVLEDIRLDLPTGAFLALLGPSGCGKTTLLRLIAGLEAADAGVLRLGDRVVLSAEQFVPPEGRGLGMVFQSYALWPNMSVRGNVELALKVRSVSRRDREMRVTEALDAVGLAHLSDRRPHELSGGQRQRVALARSLVLRPGLILLDEPLANLDAHLRQRMLAEFRRLHTQTGATFILVTHDQDEAMAVASHIAVMEAGRIEQIGTPEQLYRRPATAMVARFIGHGTTVPVQVVTRCEGRCLILLDGIPLELPGTAPPGPGWLCLHRENLRLSDGQGHFQAQVLAKSFRNGGYLTHVLPRGIGIDLMTLLMDRPVDLQSTLAIDVVSGWVIARDDGAPGLDHASEKRAVHA